MTKEILETLDEKNLTQFVYDMYELYHSEAIENAFTDLDSLIKTGKPGDCEKKSVNLINC